MKLSNIAAVKSTCCVLGLGAALFVVGLPAANALTVNYASGPDDDDQVVFNGGSFAFSSNFVVGSVNKGTNNPAKLTGSLGSIGGLFSIGADYPGYANTLAHVAGAGVLTIIDKNNVAFTADVNWINVGSGGTNTGLNYFGQLNLTNRKYSGIFSDLKTLVSAPKVWSTLTFQFGVPMTTKKLRTLNQGTDGISYSGSIYTSTVPLPAAAWLFGSALLGMGSLTRRKQPAQKEEAAA